MNKLFTDSQLLRTTFVVIDFEALTPAGRRPEPIEVATVAGRFNSTGQWQEIDRFSALMRPPADVPVTPFDVRLTGITADMLATQHLPTTVLAALDERFTQPPYLLVAHSAATEAMLISGQREHCPTLATTPLLCTVKLAKNLLPELSSHKLDAVARYFSLSIPADRHRALPDVELTVEIFTHILNNGATAGKWANLLEVQTVGGVYVKPAVGQADANQTQLF